MIPANLTKTSDVQTANRIGRNQTDLHLPAGPVGNVEETFPRANGFASRKTLRARFCVYVALAHETETAHGLDKDIG